MESAAAQADAAPLLATRWARNRHLVRPLSCLLPEAWCRGLSLARGTRASGFSGVARSLSGCLVRVQECLNYFELYGREDVSNSVHCYEGIRVFFEVLT